MKLKKTIAVLMTSFVLSSVLCSAVPASGITRFSDVPSDHWGYTTIMQMASVGIFKGTSEPVNGVGTFSPDNVMSRAEFITAALRAVYPNEASLIRNGITKWWDNYYVFAFQKGIVKWTELDNGDLDKPMTRAEMAMVLVRCVEGNGEKLTKRIKTTQIPDFDKVGDYYKDYVLDCFSFGLLCGVDDNGTFAPDVLLTRAQAATVICRLIEKSMRIEVDFIDDPTSGDNTTPGNTGSDDTGSDNPGSGSSNGNWRPNVGVGNNNQGRDEDEDEDIPVIDDELITPAPEEPEDKIELPWENGGKQPSAYTWAEFEALSSELKDAFIAKLGGTDGFNSWKDTVQGDDSGKLPWENGGKQPSAYTWAEFEALTGTQKDAFIESFGSNEAFAEWAANAQGTDSDKLPWENGGKQPSAYTWAEFEALSGTQKDAFITSFGSIDEFNKWAAAAQGTQNAEKLPWENGGKQPSAYTWAEFEALSGTQKDAFIASFGSTTAFNEWKNAAQGTQNTEKLPWENGGKQPSAYTWAEFEALSGTQKDAFIASFGSTAAFNEWKNVAQGVQDTEKLPWENGGKQPSEYTWAEYEALNGIQKDAFYESFDSPEAFAAWFNANKK